MLIFKVLETYGKYFLLMFQGFPFAILRDFTGNIVGQDVGQVGPIYMFFLLI